jgi:hypothetical protein
MKCHTNIKSTSFTQLPHKFSYIVAILGRNHFESPNTLKRIMILSTQYFTPTLLFRVVKNIARFCFLECFRRNGEND